MQQKAADDGSRAGITAQGQLIRALRSESLHRHDRLRGTGLRGAGLNEDDDVIEH